MSGVHRKGQSCKKQDLTPASEPRGYDLQAAIFYAYGGSRLPRRESNAHVFVSRRVKNTAAQVKQILLGRSLALDDRPVPAVDQNPDLLGRTSAICVRPKDCGAVGGRQRFVGVTRVGVAERFEVCQHL